jgi:hypothetical protein
MDNVRNLTLQNYLQIAIFNQDMLILGVHQNQNVKFAKLLQQQITQTTPVIQAIRIALQIQKLNPRFFLL